MITPRDLLVERVQTHDRARRLELLLYEKKHGLDSHVMDDFNLLPECLGLEIKDAPARREVVKKEKKWTGWMLLGTG